MQDKFLALIKTQEDRLKKDNVTFAALGYSKLALVVLLIFLGYRLWVTSFTVEMIVLWVLVFVLLAVLWAYHKKLHEKINFANGVIAICNRHISRISGQWSGFEDIGAEFIKADHPYACDLDIVGKKSFFQFLNTTHTWHGRQVFAHDLLQPAYDCRELQARQEAISELSADAAFLCDIQYYFSNIGVDTATPTMVSDLKEENIWIKSKVAKILLRYLPVLSCLLVAGMVIFQQKGLYLYGVSFIALQSIIWVAGIPKTNNYLMTMASLPYKLSAYSEVIAILLSRNYTSERLNQLKESLREAQQGLQRLGKIADKISVKNNGIFNFIVNIFLLWDYECVFSLEKWKKEYSPWVESWFLALGEFESLLCLSHLPNLCAHTCLPNIKEKGQIIEAKDMGHPLLLNDSRVNNDFRLSDSIFIISGSNMSGKTTLLRTVGINLVLARSGGFVCAQNMACSLLEIMTSMRIADDLNEGISTFYAELKRVKQIMVLAEVQPDMIFLIDEIFRGTNSVDRLTGAKAVVKKLHALGVIGLISTHDLALCDLSEEHQRIRNYSFSEYYADKKICFDYKMKPEKSNTTNAQYLMEMVGIV